MGGGDEDAALTLLLHGAIDATIEQQQQQAPPLSVRFAKVPTSAVLPRSRPRDCSGDASLRHAEGDVFQNDGERREEQVACATETIAAIASFSACSESSAALIAGTSSSSADCRSVNDWVQLLHPDDHSVVAFGNVATREFSVQIPVSSGVSSAESTPAENAP